MPLPRGHIEGRAVADPEMRFASTGKAVAKMRLVASDRRQNEAGEWVDSATLWIDVTCFGPTAENVAESIRRGDDVVVVGRFQTDEWDDKETGAKRSKTVFLADSVGPSLRWGPRPHSGATRSTAATPAADDPWAGGSTDDAPPF